MGEALQRRLEAEARRDPPAVLEAECAAAQLRAQCIAAARDQLRSAQALAQRGGEGTAEVRALADRARAQARAAAAARLESERDAASRGVREEQEREGAAWARGRVADLERLLEAARDDLRARTARAAEAAEKVREAESRAATCRRTVEGWERSVDAARRALQVCPPPPPPLHKATGAARASPEEVSQDLLCLPSTSPECWFRWFSDRLE